MSVDGEEVGLKVAGREDNRQGLNEIFAKRGRPVVHIDVMIRVDLTSDG